jgi:hypothetical protein
VALTDIVHYTTTSTMGKPSKARGGGGSRLGGKSAAPVGTSGRAKSLRNGAVNRREKVDEHIPASLVTSSEDEGESDEDSEEGSEQEGSEEDGEEGEEESSEEEEISIAVPVAMWVSNSSSQASHIHRHNVLPRRISTTATRNDVPAKNSPDTA